VPVPADILMVAIGGVVSAGTLPLWFASFDVLCPALTVIGRAG